METTCRRGREDVRADATRQRIHKCDGLYAWVVRRQTRNKHNKKRKKTVDKSPRYRAPGWIGMELEKDDACMLAGWMDAFWNK